MLEVLRVKERLVKRAGISNNEMNLGLRHLALVDYPHVPIVEHLNTQDRRAEGERGGTNDSMKTLFVYLYYKIDSLNTLLLKNTVARNRTSPRRAAQKRTRKASNMIKMRRVTL